MRTHAPFIIYRVGGAHPGPSPNSYKFPPHIRPMCRGNNCLLGWDRGSVFPSVSDLHYLDPLCRSRPARLLLPASALDRLRAETSVTQTSVSHHGDMQIKVNIGRLSNVPLPLRPVWMEHILSEINVGILIIGTGEGGGAFFTSPFCAAMINTGKSE